MLIKGRASLFYQPELFKCWLSSNAPAMVKCLTIWLPLLFKIQKMFLITTLLHFANLYKDNISFSSFPEVSYADGDSVKEIPAKQVRLNYSHSLWKRSSCSPFHTFNDCKSGIHIDEPVKDYLESVCQWETRHSLWFYALISLLL